MEPEEVVVMVDGVKKGRSELLVARQKDGVLSF